MECDTPSASDDADGSLFEDSLCDQGPLPYAHPEHLRPSDQVIIPNVLERTRLTLGYLWNATVVLVSEIFGRVPKPVLPEVHRNRNTSARGFAVVNKYTAKMGKTSSNASHSTSMASTSMADGITVDVGELLQQERAVGMSQRDPGALERYEQYHQEHAMRSQSAFRNRLHHPRVAEAPGSVIPTPEHGGTSPDGPRFWAVLIGIDGYEVPLRGCVEDVAMMQDYLITYLGVLPRRIKLLLGKGAGDRSGLTSNLHPTRTNIIATLHELSMNSEIKQGDSIIIFFSGHGSAYHCLECSRRIFDSHSPVRSRNSEPDELHQHRCPIEALCPIDRGTLNIPDISDREINNILAEIYRATGAYITVILDCCHSGGVTRAPSGDVRTVHSLGNDYFKRMLDSAKEDMGCSDNYQDVWSNQWIPNMDTHIVLAACEDYEYAKEWQSQSGYRGVFTEALVKVLKSNLLGKEATYIDLINALPKISGQNPVLSGRRRKERLWR